MIVLQWYYSDQLPAIGTKADNVGFSKTIESAIAHIETVSKEAASPVTVRVLDVDDADPSEYEVKGGWLVSKDKLTKLQ